MKKQLSVKTSILYKRLLAYVKPFWPILALGIFANILYSLIDAGFTYMMRPFLIKALSMLIWNLSRKFLISF